MFKKLRLWLIKKLKATPNELFNNNIKLKTYEKKITTINVSIPKRYIDHNESIEDIKYMCARKLAKELVPFITLIEGTNYFKDYFNASINVVRNEYDK